MIAGFGGSCSTCGALPGHQRPAETRPGQTVLVSIGNSDDRLTQAQWARFYEDVDTEIRALAVDLCRGTIHGAWASLPTAPWQNAAWAFTAVGDDWYGEDGTREHLRERLVRIAASYGQESVAWSEADTEFLTPSVG